MCNGRPDVDPDHLRYLVEREEILSRQGKSAREISQRLLADHIVNVNKKGDKVKRLLFDLETAPSGAWIWRTGKQFVGHNQLQMLPRDGNIILACWKWQHEKKIHHAVWDKEGDLPVVKALLPFMLEADELVGHNGDRYDIPYMNTRIMAHNLGPVPMWKSVDTLVIARKRFRFQSNRLDAIGKLFLNHGKNPMSFSDWLAIKEDNCEKTMGKMLRYCKQDIRLLSDAWDLMDGFHGVKTHVGVLHGKERWTCPSCGSGDVRRDKKNVTAAGTIRHQMRCNSCKKYYTISEKLYKDWKEQL